MFTTHINRIRSGFMAGAMAALIFALPYALFAQSSPLTVQPSTGRVGIGNTNPQYPCVGNGLGSGYRVPL